MALKTWCMIPPSALHDERLNDVDKVLLGTIIPKIGKTGYFWKSNAYLADETNRSERSVQRSISNLKKAGYLVVANKDGYRRMSVDLTGGDRFDVPGVTDLSPEELLDTNTGDKDNKETKTSSKDFAKNEQIKEVFEHWANRRAEFYQSTGRSFYAVRLTEQRREHISGRLSEGIPVEVLKKAIDGCFASSWHREKGVIELEKIVRNAGRVEFFVGKYDTEYSVKSAGDMEEWK